MKRRSSTPTTFSCSYSANNLKDGTSRASRGQQVLQVGESLAQGEGCDDDVEEHLGKRQDKH